MAEDVGKIPEWLATSDDGWPLTISGEMLSKSLDQMHEALKLFYTHVRYGISLLASIPAAVIVLLKIPHGALAANQVCLLGAAVLLTLPWLLARRSRAIVTKYYEVCVAALVFATRVHIAAGLQAEHPWLVRTIAQAQRWRADVRNSQEFLTKRAKSREDTLFGYKRMLWILSCGSAALGMLLLLAILLA